MTEQTAQEQTATNLELQDLAALLRIVDAASQRGAFRAAEMQEIGTVYNKVTAFLQAAMPKQEEAPAEGEQAAEEETAA